MAWGLMVPKVMRFQEANQPPLQAMINSHDQDEWDVSQDPSLYTFGIKDPQVMADVGR